jgi:hypothetical protein
MDFGHKSFVHTTGLKERIEKVEKENQMSREIRFRAWNKVTESMDEVSQIIFLPVSAEVPSFHGNWAQIKFLFRDDWLLVPQDVEIMQSTGLKDKKRTKEYPEGQEIYEGDKIKFGDNKFWCVVVWNDKGFYQLWRNTMINWTLWIDDYYNNSGHRKDLEVVGNIHQPEEQENA